MVVWTNLFVQTDDDGGGWIYSAYVPWRSSTAEFNLFIAVVCGYDAATTRGETYGFAC